MSLLDVVILDSSVTSWYGGTVMKTGVGSSIVITMLLLVTLGLTIGILISSSELLHSEQSALNTHIASNGGVSNSNSCRSSSRSSSRSMPNNWRINDLSA